MGLLAGFAVGAAISAVIFFITMIFTSENYYKSKSLEDFIASSKSNKYSGVLKDSLTTEYFDELNKNIIVIIPVETLKSVKTLNSKDLGNFKSNDENNQSSQELDDELNDNDAFSDVDD
ncbi:Putative colicin V production membrane protein [Rickettsia bellii OSU 85-389]|nr:Putative colicin V production membrane protein [Rickettsia bellii OSU 85-389]